MSVLCPCSTFALSKRSPTRLLTPLQSLISVAKNNVSIGVVGKDYDFTILDETTTAAYLSQIEGDDKRGRPTEPTVQDDSKPPQDPSADEGPQDPQVAIAMDTD